jgi:hypothetical protein
VQVQGPVARNAQHLGPQLYTRSQPHPLFESRCYKENKIDEHKNARDNIRISGFRLHGPHVDSPDGSDSLERGIMITACKGIEIDNMELAGWSGQAVYVQDDVQEWLSHPEEVKIHDNFFHHNQHMPGGNGYGVEVKHGARLDRTQRLRL